MEVSKATDSYIKRILFCTDFSENADFAFDFALDSATKRPGCKLYLLHVVPESDAQFWKTYLYEVEDIDQKAKQAIDARVSEKYLSRVPQELDFEVVFRVGKDYIQILEFAQEKSIDLIVIGRQGRGTLQKALFGNVTEKVARRADCAVLIIPLSFEKRQKKINLQ